GQLMRGNLGRSYITSESIGEQIQLRIRPTLELMGAALLFSIVVGVTLGIVSALKQYSFLDYLLTMGGFAGISIPVFFLALILIYVFALRLGWLPASGYATPGQDPSLVDRLRHILMPAISLGLLRTAMFMRYTRAAVLEVINQDYIRTAHAKGLKDITVILKHVVRSSLLPLITVIGLTLPVLFGGAVIIEQIFQWPGIGLLFIVAIEARDGPQIMGIALISAIIVLSSNLLTDIAYAWIDPRIRYD
nr:ABC transporter permease [Ardenticatenaceae bacterium]